MKNGDRFEHLISKWMMEEQPFLNQVVSDGMRMLIIKNIREEIRVRSRMEIDNLNVNIYPVAILLAITTVHYPLIQRLFFLQ